MNKDKWTQQLHDKLEGYETPAPEGLWDDIEVALAQQPKPLKSRHVALRRWAVAAAFATLILGGGYLWWNQNDYKADVQQLSEVMPAKEEIMPPKTASVVTVTEEPHQETVADEPRQETLSAEVVAMLSSETVADIERPTTTQAAPVVTAAEEPRQESDVVDAVEMSAAKTVVHELDRQIAELPATKQRQSLTFSLYAMNGFTNENSSNGVLMADAMVRQFEKTYENSYESSARLSEPVYLSGYEERQHHHRPLSYGLTVAYPFTKRLSLTTGVVYTKLASDFTQVMHSQQIQQQQTLHYIGIPVSLSYRLWAFKGFRSYVSAGTLTYWNVATHLVTEGVTQKLGKDRVQWAFNGSIGVQYDVLPPLGLYVEPGLSYYPDNGSRLQNFFKDKPLNPSFQVGLRVNYGH